eukprot:15327621-Ditylum_brightwellii.AAC.1
MMLNGAYEILMGHQPSRQSRRWKESEGIVFVNDTRDACSAANMRCFRCNMLVHCACNCNTLAGESKNVETAAVMLGNTKLSCEDEHEFAWCQETTNLINQCNKELLNSIHEVEEYATVKGNRGTLYTNKRGTMPYNSKKDNGFVVQKGDKSMLFKQSAKGLFYCDMASQETCFTNDAIEEETKPTRTVEDNKKLFTKQEVKVAKIARPFMAMVGRSSLWDLT